MRHFRAKSQHVDTLPEDKAKQVKIRVYREECENVTRFAFSPMINSSFWIGPRHGAELVARFEFYSKLF